MMKHFLPFLIAIFGVSLTSNAKSPFFFHRIDINTGNLYTFAASNLITAGINKVTNDRLCDNSFSYTIYDYDAPDSKIKDYNRGGESIRDLFADTSVGTRLGYQSFNLGFFNWGIYGSAHYRINQFKIKEQDITIRNNMQRLQVGAGLMVSFGTMENENKLILEAGIRYNLPIYYHISNIEENQKALMKKGISSHYSIRMGGLGPLKGLGVFLEVPHYNMFKSDIISLKPYTFGLTYTIMPWDM